MVILPHFYRCMRIAHIYWFAHYNLAGPCVRYRGKYFLERLLRDHYISSSFVFPGYHVLNILHFTRVYFSALFFRRRNSIIVFQKIYTNGIYANALKILLLLQRKNTIYDIDDAYYLKFPPSTMHFFLKHSQIVVAGSDELLRYSGLFKKTVFLNPSVTIGHGRFKKKRNAVLTIGWVGFYNAHRESLTTLFLPAMLRVEINVRLVLLGVTQAAHIRELRAFFLEKENITLEIPENIDWQDEVSVYEKISEFDLGISPLIDNAYNRAKSAFKLKQYLSCGVPVLGSSVGENKAVIRDGVNGYFCETPEDYVRLVHFFNQLPDDVYENYCSNARLSSALYSMDQYCSRFIAISDDI